MGCFLREAQLRFQRSLSSKRCPQQESSLCLSLPQPELSVGLALRLPQENVNLASDPAHKEKLEEMLALLHTEVERWWTPNPPGPDALQ